MKLNTSPIEVNIKREVSQPISREAFYNVCFITENDYAPRTLEVTKLQDLLENGYSRISFAYIFCLTVFRQKGMPKVYVRAKRTTETYVEAYDADNNLTYYFITIESKFLSQVLALNDHLKNSGDSKLQFLSHNQNISSQLLGRKLVFFYYPFEVGDFGNYLFDERENVLWDNRDQVAKEKELAVNIQNYFLNKVYGTNTLPYLSDGKVDKWKNDKDGFVEWDDEKKLLLQKHELTLEQIHTSFTPYPEASWIAHCGNFFPSQTQWLYKFLPAIPTIKPEDIPDLSTVHSVNLGVKGTFGSGKTMQGVRISEQVCMDWVQWAVEQNLWKLLYQSENIPATQIGLTLLENALKEVLDVAVQNKIFLNYKVTDRKLDRVNNKASFKFSAYLIHSILQAEVEGTVYH